MRYLTIIGDGIADGPVKALGGKTPLSYLALPGMARLASAHIGLVRTVPAGTPAGSDTAILSIFGYDPRTCYTGRAALEAAGAGVLLHPGEVAWRVNLCTVAGDTVDTAVMRSHNGAGIGGQQALDTVARLLSDPAFSSLCDTLSFALHKNPTFRQMGVAPGGDHWGARLPGPHDHLGERIDTLLPDGSIRKLVEASLSALRGGQANCIWPWCPGAAMSLDSFPALHGHHGPVISAVPLVKGIGLLCGLTAPQVPGATGEIDTNYEGKAAAAMQGFRDGADFALIHVEAPDECSHALDVQGKLEAIRRLDARIILPVLQQLDADGEPCRILFLSDHPTLLETGAHDSAPVPYCLYDSRMPGTPRPFNERTATQGALLEDGTQLMAQLFEAMPAG